MYYSRYTTGKKGLMHGFSMLQLVTSEPRAAAIPEAQPTQPFLVPQCPGTSWLLALTLMHPPIFFWLIEHMTSLVMH
jgi:hypothetical protein